MYITGILLPVCQFFIISLSGILTRKSCFEKKESCVYMMRQTELTRKNLNFIQNKVNVYNRPIYFMDNINFSVIYVLKMRYGVH